MIRAASVLTASCLAAALAGCLAPRTDQGTIGPDDFLAPAAAGPGETRRPPIASAPATPRPSDPRAADARSPSSPDADAPGADEINTEPGAPTLAPSAPVGGAVLIDAKVGDLNGVPIYANEIFAELGDRLEAEARRLDRNAWRAQARNTIRTALRDRLDASVFESEARDELLPGARQGLLAVIDLYRRELISGARGSSQLAAQNARSQGFRTVDEAIDDSLRSELIARQISREVSRRVSVSFQEVQRRYEQQYDRFNPPPRAVFYRIFVRTRDPEGRDRIEERLASGENFIDVAKDQANTNRADENVREVYDLERGQPMTARTLNRVDAINEAMTRLDPGAWAGPIEHGPFVRWYYLDRIEDNTRTLYEVQELITRELEAEKRGVEFLRYRATLIAPQAMNELERIAERLLDIAERRYLSDR